MFSSRMSAVTAGAVLLTLTAIGSVAAANTLPDRHRRRKTTPSLKQSGIPAAPSRTTAQPPRGKLPPIEPFRHQSAHAFADITELLKKRQYRLALEQIERTQTDRRTPADRSQHHYFHGMALLYMGDYTAAGLSFMRVIVFYPDSACYGMALYRTAQVHERIRRLDIALSLYRRADRLPSAVYNSQPRVRAAQRLAHIDLAQRNSNLRM